MCGVRNCVFLSLFFSPFLPFLSLSLSMGGLKGKIKRRFSGPLPINRIADVAKCFACLPLRYTERTRAQNRTGPSVRPSVSVRVTTSTDPAVGKEGKRKGKDAGGTQLAEAGVFSAVEHSATLFKLSQCVQPQRQSTRRGDQDTEREREREREGARNTVRSRRRLDDGRILSRSADSSRSRALCVCV